jgi:trimethylamine--corrinoid protein Co-methyltransferase
MAALAGANLIYGLGMIESGMTFDYGQLVMDNEFVKMIKHILGGIPVNDETLSVDVIKEVGPFGDFLSHQNTLQHMRSQSQSRLLDRAVRSNWEAAGATTLYERARAEARRIMESHQPDPLTDEVLAALREIVESVEQDLGLHK